MSIRTVTYMSTLMRLAHEMGKAQQSGDQVAYESAKKAHDEYHVLCMASDDFVCEVPL